MLAKHLSVASGHRILPFWIRTHVSVFARHVSVACMYLCTHESGTFVFARHVSVAWVGSQVVGTQVLIDLCQHCDGHIVIYDLLVAFVGHLHMRVTASLDPWLGNAPAGVDP